jgi:DNA-directed RNA polymerase subunit RPC12/RpoP
VIDAKKCGSGCYKAASVAIFADRCERMSKQSMREEAERLIRETMERKTIVVKQGNTRIETLCGKCGAPNRISAEKGTTRVKFACKNCGHKQETL